MIVCIATTLCLKYVRVRGSLTQVHLLLLDLEPKSFLLDGRVSLQPASDHGHCVMVETGVNA